MLLAQERGLAIVGLRADSHDWKHVNPDAIRAAVLREVGTADDQKSQTVLLHDAGGDRQATVAALPAFVKITFSEPVGSVTSVRLLDARGKDHVVTAGLNPRNAAQVMAKTKASAPGTYTAKWAIVSDDGHKITGTFTFKVKK